jgi:hypothetical protein
MTANSMRLQEVKILHASPTMDAESTVSVTMQVIASARTLEAIHQKHWTEFVTQKRA